MLLLVKQIQFFFIKLKNAQIVHLPTSLYNVMENTPTQKLQSSIVRIIIIAPQQYSKSAFYLTYYPFHSTSKLAKSKIIISLFRAALVKSIGCLHKWPQWKTRIGKNIRSNCSRNILSFYLVCKFNCWIL